MVMAMMTATAILRPKTTSPSAAKFSRTKTTPVSFAVKLLSIKSILRALNLFQFAVAFIVALGVDIWLKHTFMNDALLGRNDKTLFNFCCISFCCLSWQKNFPTLLPTYIWNVCFMFSTEITSYSSYIFFLIRLAKLCLHKKSSRKNFENMIYLLLLANK